MLTKCPACSTTFRVTPTQLKTRAGKVRCGRCSLVFNALDTLADDAANVAATAAPPPADATREAASAQTFLPAHPDEDGRDGEKPIDHMPESAPFPQAREQPATTEVETETAEVEPDATRGDETSPLTDYRADSSPPQNEEPPRRWPWLIASLIAVIGLLTQGIYFYRVELAVLRPDLRPLLQAACKPLQCEVPYPRRVDTLSIEASDLRPDPRQPGHLTLTATLRSKAIYAQEWPLLELTLTDVADRKLAVKDFAARDYLPKETDIEAGFPANGEIGVSLSLNVGDLPAAGYRLYIFYP